MSLYITVTSQTIMVTTAGGHPGGGGGEPPGAGGRVLSAPHPRHQLGQPPHPALSAAGASDA